MDINWDAVGAIAEGTAAVAVIASLGYLAIQIRQNTRALRSSTIDAITAHQQDELRWSADLASEFRKALECPDQMSFEERWRLQEWTTAAFGARQNEYIQYRQGYLDEEIWQASEAILGILLGVAWMRDWWLHQGSQALSQSFVTHVNQRFDLPDRQVPPSDGGDR